MIEIRIVLSVIAVSKIIQIDEALVVDRQERDPVAFLLEMLAGIENRLVLGDAGDDVIALLAIHRGDALDRQVVRFRRAAREDDFARIRADQRCDLLSRLLDGLLGFPPKL